MKAGWVYGVVIALTSTGLFSGNVLRAEIVSTQFRIADFSNTFADGGGTFDSGASEVGMWANNGNKHIAAWRDLTTTGAAGGVQRSLQVGDVFTVTVNATRAFGQIGFSLNADGTRGGNYANRTDGSRLYINTDNYGAWYANRAGGDTSLQYVPLENTRKDYIFKVRMTSQTTADVTLTVDAVDYRANNLTLNGAAGANINGMSIYGSDMWDGSSNDDAYWKPTSQTENTGRVELGYFLSSANTFSPGLISDGLAANSTVTASPNAVFIGGDAGSQVNLAQDNTYTGATTVNLNATGEAQHANALGSIAAGTTVSSGGALKLYDGSGISFAAEPLTLNGTGVNAANGALRSVGGNNTWTGAITLGSNSRINADGAGSLTVSGSVSGGGNVLYMGGTGANMTVSGQISGAGATEGGTLTSLYKDGANTLTLSGNNSYTGDTRVTAGTLAVASGGNLGSGSDVYLSGTGTLDLTASPTVGTFTISGGSLTGSGTLTATTYNISGGTIAANLGVGTYNISGTPTITGSTSATGMTVASGSVLDLATTGDFSSVISGDGGVAKTGSSTLTLSGNNSYAGTTSINAGTLLFNGTNSGNGTVTVATAAAIGGTGSIAGNLTMAAGSQFSFNQAGGLSVGGTVSFTDAANFGVDDIIGLSAATPDGLYTIFNGTVTTAGLANLGSSNAYNLGSGKSAYFVPGSLKVQVVPEPDSFVIVGAGMAVACLRRLTAGRRPQRRLGRS